MISKFTIKIKSNMTEQQHKFPTMSLFTKIKLDKIIKIKSKHYKNNTKKVLKIK